MPVELESPVGTKKGKLRACFPEARCRALIVSISPRRWLSAWTVNHILQMRKRLREVQQQTQAAQLMIHRPGFQPGPASLTAKAGLFWNLSLVPCPVPSQQWAEHSLDHSEAPGSCRPQGFFSSVTLKPDCWPACPGDDPLEGTIHVLQLFEKMYFNSSNDVINTQIILVKIFQISRSI